jgi:hypothetical protein
MKSKNISTGNKSPFEYNYSGNDSGDYSGHNPGYDYGNNSGYNFGYNSGYNYYGAFEAGQSNMPTQKRRALFISSNYNFNYFQMNLEIAKKLTEQFDVVGY